MLCYHGDLIDIQKIQMLNTFEEMYIVLKLLFVYGNEGSCY